VTLSLQQETLLKRYAEAVVSAPAHLHLTSDRDLKQFWSRHVEDAIQLHAQIPSPYLKPSCRVLDVGSGNGVPGIPLAIMEPFWNLDLLDSDNKKCGFIDMFCKKYAMSNVHVIAGRAEIFAKGALRECYDVVFSRAVGKLPVALELASAFVNMGGLLIVPHGTSWKTELHHSLAAIDILGIKLIRESPYELDNIRYMALLFEKIAETPKLYPRSVGIPEKRPL